MASEYRRDINSTQFQKRDSVLPLPFTCRMILPGWLPSTSNLISSCFLHACFPFESRSLLIASFSFWLSMFWSLRTHFDFYFFLLSFMDRKVFWIFPSTHVWRSSSAIFLLLCGFTLFFFLMFYFNYCNDLLLFCLQFLSAPNLLRVVAPGSTHSRMRASHLGGSCKASRTYPRES